MAVTTVLTLASAARATYSSGPVALPYYNDLVLNLDISVTALTGGTTPSVTFKISRVEPDGVLYQLYSPTALSAAGVFAQSIGVGGQTAADPGDVIQIDMVVTGAPTSITFSLTLKARGF